MYCHRFVWFLFAMIGPAAALPAQSYKQLPPPGIQIDQQDRGQLSRRVQQLQSRIEETALTHRDSDAWRADVEVLVRAVQLALDQDGFYRPSEPKVATGLLDEAQRRLAVVSQGTRGLRLLGWDPQKGDEPQLLVGGFESQIDNSVQPFGLVVPAGYTPSASAFRVDIWLHGRGDTKTELPFLHERMTKVGTYAPRDTVVLHPFGRHCNAFKFAGETDVYEALEHLDTLITVNRDRVAVRGFSMGGAGCWHLAVHNPGRWFAANPGAGFVDTIVYQGWSTDPPFAFDNTRRKLMNWYDVLPWVSNLKNTRTVAYSGEVDKQKQAADRVALAAEEAGFEFPYVIGQGMGHKVDSASVAKVDAMIDGWSQEPTKRPRREIDFVTYTLRYNRVDWLQVTGLKEHWSQGRVQAKLEPFNQIQITTEGVTRLKLDFRDSGWPLKPIRPRLTIDGQKLTLDDWEQAPGIQCELVLGEQWSVVEEVDLTLRKKPGLQGPIDDAFCSRFVFVVPSRPAVHGVVQRWVDRELEYAIDRWTRLMRGNVRIVQDTAVTADQIERSHLICFGDFTSNQYLRAVSMQLPIKWTRKQLQVGSRQFDPSTHAAAFCFPNPRNPDRYLVVNSGMTFREFSNVSNSRQIAMLPDWVIMDVSDERDAGAGIFPGVIAAEGFFDERWMLKP